MLIRFAAVPVAAGAVSFAWTAPRVCATLALLGDSPAFVSAAANLGIAQPSGYPLYTWLGHAFAQMPLGSVAWRVNLSSAVYHAVAVALVAAAIQHLTASRIAAFGGALVLATSQTFFLASQYAEVFPLNDLLTALLLLLGLRFADSARDLAAADRIVLGLAVTTGVASAHHQMIALTAPTLLILLAKGPWRFALRGARLGWPAAAALLPFVALYASLLWLASRDPTPSWGDLASLRDLWQLFSRADYGGLSSPYRDAPTALSLEHLRVYFAAVWRQIGPAGCGLAAIGCAYAVVHQRTAALACATLFAVSGPLFAVANRIPVGSEAGVAFADRFTTMSAIAVAVFVGYGIAAIGALLPRGANLACAAAAAVGIVAAWATPGRLADLSADRIGDGLAQDLLGSVADGALVLLAGDVYMGTAYYHCHVERRCGRTVAFASGQLHLDWRRRQLLRTTTLQIPGVLDPATTAMSLIRANLTARPVYISPRLLDFEPDLRDAFGYLPEGLVLRVVADDQAAAGLGGAFRERAAHLAAGRGCAGCPAARTRLAYPSLQAEIAGLYADALRNHALVAREFFGMEDDAAAIDDRADRIESRRRKVQRLGNSAAVTH